MSSLLNYTSFMDYQDKVSIYYGGKPVGNRDNCALSGHLTDCCLNLMQLQIQSEKA